MVSPDELIFRTFIKHEADVHQAVMQAYALFNPYIHAIAVMTEVATVVSELAMNIVKYADKGGAICLHLELAAPAYVEITAKDHGPGIADVELAISDHYSSMGTLGVGLPGVRRMMDEFKINSALGKGTEIIARRYLMPGTQPASNCSRVNHCPALPIKANATPPSSRTVDPRTMARINRPCFGELVSGDLCLHFASDKLNYYALIDVLGHGQEAFDLAKRCQHWLEHHVQSNLSEVLIGLHQEIRGSRGIAITLASLQDNHLNVAGVGNTNLYLVNHQVQLFPAQPGIVGSNMPRLITAHAMLAEQDVLILTSDGISERIDSQYFLARKHFPLQRLVASLLDDFGKIYDDASCMAVRYQS